MAIEKKNQFDESTIEDAAKAAVHRQQRLNLSVLRTLNQLVKRGRDNAPRVIVLDCLDVQHAQAADHAVRLRAQTEGFPIVEDEGVNHMFELQLDGLVWDKQYRKVIDYCKEVKIDRRTLLLRETAWGYGDLQFLIARLLGKQTSLYIVSQPADENRPDVEALTQDLDGTKNFLHIVLSERAEQDALSFYAEEVKDELDPAIGI